MYGEGPSEAEKFLKEQAVNGTRVRTVAAVVFCFIFGMAFAVPLMVGLMKAVLAVPKEAYPVLGLGLMGVVIVGVALGAYLALMRWLGQPGTQGPAWMSGLEESAERNR